MSRISSVQNPRIKKLVKLREKAGLRREEGLFIIEGARELLLAARHGYDIRELFVCRQLIEEKVITEINNLLSDVEYTEVNISVYQKVAVRDSTEGIIALARYRDHNITDLKIPENPLLLVIEKVEKPGNLGALLRTADAAGIDAVLICDPKVDLYNPNVIRAGLGCLFTLQIAQINSEDAIKWLKGRDINIFAATPEGAQVYHQSDFAKPAAIVVGAEAEGLSDIWLNNADARIFIPMKGGIDSLNVSVSAAVVVFEAVRQRNGI